MTRDDRGRFAKGGPGGPGRSKKEVEESYLQAFRDGVSQADWQAIISRAVHDAKRGDATARKFIADYLIGMPKQTVGIEGPDGGPLIIRYVNDWRDIATNAASGTTDSNEAPGAA